jgi:hypothetical protein
MEGKNVFYVAVNDTNISLEIKTILRNITYFYHILMSFGFLRVQGLRKCS